MYNNPFPIKPLLKSKCRKIDVTKEICIRGKYYWNMKTHPA
jgi:hypothetical protein